MMFNLFKYVYVLLWGMQSNFLKLSRLDVRVKAMNIITICKGWASFIAERNDKHTKTVKYKESFRNNCCTQ